MGCLIRLIGDHPEVQIDADYDGVMESWENMLKENGVLNVESPTGQNIALNAAQIVSIQRT